MVRNSLRTMTITSLPTITVYYWVLFTQMVSINADAAETGLWVPEGSAWMGVVKGTASQPTFFTSVLPS